MKYDSNSIATANKEIEVGKQYDYTEDRVAYRVLVLEDNSNSRFIELKLKVLSEPRGEIFEVSSNRELGHYFYNGMWRLWDAGEYIRGEYQDSDEIIPEGGLIGYSLSKCVASILRNKIDLNRVKQIIARTAMRDNEDLHFVCREYEYRYWYPFKGKGTEIAELLWREGKIIQPRIGHPQEIKHDMVWEKA